MATKTKPPTNAQLVAQIKRLRREGVSNAAIAVELGIGLASVYRLVPAKQNGQPVKASTAKAAKVPAKTAAKAPFNGGKSVGLKDTRPQTKVPVTAKASAKAPKVKVDTEIGEHSIAIVKAADLHRWLSDVQPFRGYDDTLPMLTGTHVEWDGKRFLAATTDRFTLGISKLDVPEEPPRGVTTLAVLDENVDFMLAPNDAAALLRISKTAKRDIDWRLVTISRIGEIPAGATVPTFTYRFAFFSGESLTVKPFDVEFPKFRHLLPSGKPVARALSAFTNEYLVKFAKVANDHSGRIKLYSFDDNETGGAKPTAVLIGDNFVGLIMPVRCEDAAWVKPGWIA